MGSKLKQIQQLQKERSKPQVITSRVDNKFQSVGQRTISDPSKIKSRVIREREKRRNRSKIKEITPEDIEREVRKEEERLKEIELNKLQGYIDGEKQVIFETNQKRQASIDKVGGIGSPNRAEIREYDDVIEFSKRVIRNLEKSKSIINKGGTYADATRYATARTRGQIENIENKKKVRKQIQEEYGEKLNIDLRAGAFYDKNTNKQLSIKDLNRRVKEINKASNISYDNKVKWEKQNIEITPEQKRELQEIEFDTNINRMNRAYNPLQETIGGTTQMSKEEEEYWKRMMALASTQKDREDKYKENKTGFWDGTGKWDTFNVNIPLGFGLAKGLKFNPHETEKWLTQQTKETHIGAIKDKTEEIQAKYGDKYGNVNIDGADQKKIDEYNKDINKLKSMQEEYKNIGAWEGIKDSLDYRGTQALKLINPESARELITEAGAITGAVKLAPIVAGGIGKWASTSPATFYGTDAVLTGYDAYQSHKAYKEKDWLGMSDSGMATTVSATPYIFGGLSKAKNLFTNKAFMLADTGEMVPTYNRLGQIDDIINGNMKYAITSKPNIDDMNKFSNVLDTTNPDYTYGVPHRWATWNVGESMPSSQIFLKDAQGRIVNNPSIEVLSKGKGFETIKLDDLTKRRIYEEALTNNGKISDDLAEYLFKEAQKQATALSKEKGERVLVATLSPKRTRGFVQPEMEMSLVAPIGEYSVPKTKFGGFVNTGSGSAKIYSQDKGFNIKDLLPKDHTSNYWKRIAEDKMAYLKGGKSITGEYAQHGADHLLPMDKYNEFYKYHDITKVADIDSFMKYPHGEEAYNLWKKGVFPDKRIYSLPYNEQKAIAEAWKGHKHARFQFDSLFTNPKTNKFTIPDRDQLYWYLKNKINPNEHLEMVSTLDRIDFARFGIEPDPKFMSKKALKKLGFDNVDNTKDIINRMDDSIKKDYFKIKELEKKVKSGKKLTPQEKIIYNKAKNVQSQYNSMSNYQRNNIARKYLNYHNINYQSPYLAGYPTAVGKYHQNYIEKAKGYGHPLGYGKGGSYPSYPMPYITPTKVNIPITPPIITQKDGGSSRKRIRKLLKKHKKTLAHQPIFYTDEGKRILGRYFPNVMEAKAEGIVNTDESPINRFSTRKTIVKEALLSRHPGTKAGYKFKKKGKIYIEKIPYRYDKKGELRVKYLKGFKGTRQNLKNKFIGRKGFNIMPYVFPSY